MTKYMIRRSLITRDNALLGIITSSDLARMMHEQNRADPTLKDISQFADVERLGKQ